MMSAEDLEKTIRQQIPALRQFSFHISELTPRTIRVDARLSDHINHKGTAFGGSLYQVALVASYGLFLHLMELNKIQTHDFVISKGEMHYRAPVTGNFHATLRVSEADADHFLQTLQSQKKAELWLRTQVYTAQKLGAELKARFVAFL